jgi:GAF domain-containing protein
LKKSASSDRMSTPLGKDGGPVLDEATFQKLLAAAYVLQEHHDRTSSPASNPTPPENPNTDSDTSILAQIVETQHEIQTGHLDLDGTTGLVLERILKITGAQGSSIGILEGDEFVYRAARGILGAQSGKTVRPEAALSASTLLHDMILRCPQAATDFRVNPELTRRLGIGSFISVPVLHNGKTGGSLELAFSQPDAFGDQDVRTCQLMAGLVTETLTRTTEEQWRRGLAEERASMLEVLEKIKPQLARLANSPDAAVTLSQVHPPASDEMQCHQCGNSLAPGEAFCGACGSSRASGTHGGLQSKWATLWNLKVAEDERTSDSVMKPGDDARPPIEQHQYSESRTTPAPSSQELSEMPASSRGNEASQTETKHETVVTEEQTPETTLVPKGPAETRVWLRSIAVSPPAVQLKGFWQNSAAFVRAHRGDLAMGASFVLFLITIFWAVSSNHTTTSADSGNVQPATTSPAKPRRKPIPQPPKLSFFEQMLVSLGLAEPPPAPSYSGNPNVPVWVDVHTALYYCPGSDLYGKTAQGKIASQRDAQMDQFEPASRKVCD